MEGMTTDLNQVMDEIKINSRNMSIWMKIVGIISIASGALTALSIVGIIFAWVPIWMGVLLMQASSRADEAQLSNRPEAIPVMLDKLRIYFLIQGILVLIGIVFAVIGVLVFGLSFGPFLDSFSH